MLICILTAIYLFEKFLKLKRLSERVGSCFNSSLMKRVYMLLIYLFLILKKEMLIYGIMLVNNVEKF